MYLSDIVARLFSPTSYALSISAVLLLLYLRHVNRALASTPDEAARAASLPWTDRAIRETYQKIKQSPVDIRKHLPPKQSRRYIVTGGAGLVGGSLVQHLLARGEDIGAIRIIDVRRPTPEVAGGLRRSAELSRVHFEAADITSPGSVDHAFSVPWPSSVADRPLTVFHTAATIRFAERAEDLLPLSEQVNVLGTKNVLAAAKAAGASIFIATSSGAIAIRRANFWVWPWQRFPTRFFQTIRDADYDLTRPHATYFGNYPVSKATAERIVRAADDPSTHFRTGAIRPASGVYGTSQDNTVGSYMRRGGVVDWIAHIINPFVYTENVSLAHLLLERYLITPARSTPGGEPVDIGGSAFTVTDPNPPIRFGDIARLLCTLLASPITFTPVPPIVFFVLAHLIEGYALLQFRYARRVLPALKGDLAFLQPALFAICCVHLFYDDGEARKRPEEGGLGYRGAWTSMEAMCQQVLVWNEEWKARFGGEDMGKKEEESVLDEVKGVAGLATSLPVASAQSS
ncbi:putative 3-beta hydroxysteroid dehydrogenase/isomerase family protein [Macrophomina phaseolina]|uniref:3-beta hydroxysteroid dehydrogenase/isomerase family protein n=1 Tax=Macrophomina phaseolina TaxID=35725 RepID=A0ABQ8G8N3_9PEZI|nr:putative 3-beta hydroxysteroid dehydrogenase/isomerase family protein [Macrophomina phaseolina]